MLKTKKSHAKFKKVKKLTKFKVNKNKNKTFKKRIKRKNITHAKGRISRKPDRFIPTFESKSRKANRFSPTSISRKSISKSRNKTKVTSSKYDHAKFLLEKLNQKNDTTSKTKITKQQNIITKSIPNKNSENWKRFIENFENYKHIYEKTHKTNYEVELYRISQLVNVPINFLRSLTSDFMSNFRNDSYDLVKSNIHQACQDNFKKNQTCYCCGKEIQANEEVSCDHLIPIMSMLLIVETESINDNLFYIHKRCNGIKLDKDIFDFYSLAGTKIFTSNSNHNTKIKCRELIGSHLKNLKFRSFENILERFDRLSRIEKHLENIYEEVKLLTTTGQQALVVDALTMLGKEPLDTIPEDMESEDMESKDMDTRAQGKKTKKIKLKKHATQKNRKKKKIKKRKK